MHLPTRTLVLVPVLATAAFVAPFVAQTELSSARTVELSGAFAGPPPPFSYGLLQVRQFLLAPGEHVLYLADQDVADQVELYRVPTHGRSEPVKLNGPLADNSDVSAPALSPDGTSLAYLARQLGDDLVGVYVGPSDGSAPAARRSGVEGNVADLVFTADGQRIVYRVYDPVTSTHRLYSVRVDGVGSPVQLNVSGGGNHVPSYAPSPDGAWVVYRSDELRNGKYEVFSVPADASATRVRLNAPMSNTRDVHGFVVDPTSQTVAFYSDALVAGTIDLYVVPIDASAAPVQLSDPLRAGRSAGDARFSVDGQRLVYLSNPAGVSNDELFSVEVDGSSPPVKLNGPLGSGGTVGPFEITPDGARVLFPTIQDGTARLYAAPLDGSAAPVQLNDELAAGEFIGTFRATPDGGRALFTVASFGPSTARLFVVPLDRSTSPYEVSAPTPGVVGVFALDATGTRVAYCVKSGGQTSLVLASLDGSRAPLVLDALQLSEQLAFSEDGTTLIHRSNELGQTDSARLFATRASRSRRQSL